MDLVTFTHAYFLSYQKYGQSTLNRTYYFFDVFDIYVVAVIRQTLNV